MSIRDEATISELQDACSALRRQRDEYADQLDLLLTEARRFFVWLDGSIGRASEPYPVSLTDADAFQEVKQIANALRAAVANIGGSE